MNSTWKLVVRSFKGRPPTEGRAHVEKTILEASGLPLKLREARHRLFIVTTNVSKGTPAVIEGESGFVCLIALDDLVDIVMDPAPTLRDVMREAGLKGYD
ncbi:hypothetical protein ELH51_05480 [Rhizobium ruizarguesonis]|uniref:hypothetical protein n=1 Tax=Rhizobium TaxID=379 RepID=UPI001031C8B9|nr:MULTISPECIES: hypothetical protein [Rhizobium]MBY5646354.1 hypothetical protein [Rhizobium leguminosarum]TBB21275.1 hypothetical protein ELH51_05480 [Rhizobium ruizarguesonis]